MKLDRDNLLLFAYAGICLAYGALFVVKYNSLKGKK